MPKTPPPLAPAVQNTVAWFAALGQPVTAEEVHRFLFGTRAALPAVRQALRQSRKLASSSGFYFLRKQTACVVTRCRQHFTALKMWRRALADRWLLCSTPFLKFVAVGNTLAFGWPTAESDIDLLVVARAGRLFTARAWLTFLAHLAGRRRHGTKIAGRLCLSFFVAETAQNLAPLRLQPADPYLTFWAASLVPLFGDPTAFVAANRWLRREMPNFKAPRAASARANLFAKICEKLLGGRLGDLLEKRLQAWQLARIAAQNHERSEPTAVVATETVLKFHETDCRRALAECWQQLCK